MGSTRQFVWRQASRRGIWRARGDDADRERQGAGELARRSEELTPNDGMLQT
jgi:hypothetical protein